MMGRIFRRIKGLLTRVNPKHIVSQAKDGAFYKKELKQLKLSRNPSTAMAVIVHLYYPEIWSEIAEKIKKDLVGVKFDLYITTPLSNIEFIKSNVLPIFPSVCYVIVPNRGRDVLPFIRIAKELHKAGYDYFLKLQTKKSTHWDGGDVWMKHTLNELIPSSRAAVQTITEKLKKGAAIIGAKEFYYPLTVNFPANGSHMSNMVRKMYGSAKERKYLQVERKEYGFFGGTMFWGRLDAISPLFRYAKPQYFEDEAGQIDGTFAHALERLFCVIPEIENMKLYQLDGGELTDRPYRSDNIPAWSVDHDK